MTPQETEPELSVNVLESPVEAWVDSDLLWGQGLWRQQTWEARHVALVLLEEVATGPP